MNPLDLPGPAFLTFYVLFGAVVLVVGRWLRHLLQQGYAPGPSTSRFTEGYYPRESEVYHVAFLRGEGLKVVRHHHERWDGGGYPDGLVGTDIPLGARIFAVADALDAMTSDRPYRRARDWNSAGGEIIANAKRQFDPYVVEAFRQAQPKLREIRTRFSYAA